MNTLMKAGIALTLIGGGVATAHFVHARPIAQDQVAKLAVPVKLEAEIRAMARDHAPEGQGAAAEAHIMVLIQAHLAEVAKDPAMSAHVNAMIAKAADGDPEAMKAVHEALIGLVHGGNG